MSKLPPEVPPHHDCGGECCDYKTIPGASEYAAGLQAAVEAKLPVFAKPRTPTRQKDAKKVIPMEGTALEIAASVKEMFHGYSNRQERSQQATLGPSEIGSPCDRRLAMSLLRLPPVNPGGDNWAAFVGTCTHAGLAEMLVWADAGSGRYAPELPLTFPSEHVPFGTTDLVDRRRECVMDWKVMGSWSLNKLRTEGPGPTYRVQAHTYALGAKLAGEAVKGVAVVGMPREASSLDDMYVWYEPYQPKLAQDAIARVDRIAELVISNGDPDADGMTAHNFPIDNSDCKYCPYHMPGAVTSEGGKCNGRD